MGGSPGGIQSDEGLSVVLKPLRKSIYPVGNCKCPPFGPPLSGDRVPVVNLNFRSIKSHSLQDFT